MATKTKAGRCCICGKVKEIHADRSHLVPWNGSLTRGRWMVALVCRECDDASENKRNAEVARQQAELVAYAATLGITISKEA